MYPWKSTRDQNDSAWTWCLRPDNQRFMRQPLVTSCVGLAQGCNPLASAVFFGAYLCSDRLSCESLFGRPGRIRTDTIRALNALPLPKLGYWSIWSPERDLNPHVFRQLILSQPSLPFHHLALLTWFWLADSNHQPKNLKFPCSAIDIHQD